MKHKINTKRNCKFLAALLLATTAAGIAWATCYVTQNVYCHKASSVQNRCDPPYQNTYYTYSTENGNQIHNAQTALNGDYGQNNDPETDCIYAWTHGACPGVPMTNGSNTNKVTPTKSDGNSGCKGHS
jgi:hypothetical protein